MRKISLDNESPMANLWKGEEFNKRDQLDTKNDIILVMVPRTILHTLMSMADNSEYIVIKKFNDAMLF